MNKTLLMTTLMTTIALFGNAFAVECPVSWCYDCGDDCKAYYADRTLYVIGTGDMTSHPWYDNRTIKNEAEGIVIGEGITSVGNHSFSDMYEVKNLTLPSTLTTVGEYAFSGLTKMEELIVPDSITSFNKYSFYSMYQLKNLVLPDNLPTLGSYSDVFSSTSASAITASADALLSFLRAGGSARIGEDGKINITCTAGDCEATLRKFSKYNQENILNALNFIYPNAVLEPEPEPIVTPTPEPEPIVTPEQEQTASTRTPKRIYTVDEANAVAGKVNSFKIRYR